LDFMNDKMKKHHSSSTSSISLKIITTKSFANAKYSKNQCCKRLLDASLDHNQVGSKVATWLLCIVILKREINRSNFLSLRRVWIFTQSIFGPMIFSKQNEPLIRPSVFKTFLQHENSTNIENRLC
jgi:hypothetical protein